MSEKKLTDLFDLFDSCEDENSPVPSGQYVCEAIKGKLFEASTGTQGYKITWQVVEGEHKGKFIWQDLWLTQKAMQRSRRILRQLKITTGEQLEQPLPDGIICKLVVVKKESDNGNLSNEVKKVEFVRMDINPFAYQPAQPKPVEGDENKWDEKGNWTGTEDEFFGELNKQLKKPSPEDELGEGIK